MLKDLKSISIASNRLAIFPKVICELKALERLDVS